MEKELKNLLASFEKAKEWEWSDLFQWINRLKTLVDAFQGETFPEKITLEKRLWQCLNPALPQGLHSITLKIYESILSKPWLASTEFALFLTGILPFFQYASSENRIQVLSIFCNCYKPRIAEMKLSLSGVVMSLLTGMDQDSLDEVKNKIVDFLDQVALSHCKRELFLCVWQCVLTVPRVRFGAIAYLNIRVSSTEESTIDDFFPNRQLVVNAIISALDDREDQVCRASMDLLKLHFPIMISEVLITTKEKISLIESALKLFLRKSDMHIPRRIWQWLLLGENDEEHNEDAQEYICELLIEAMKSIFNSDHVHPTHPIEILGTLIQEAGLVKSLLKELAVPMIIYAEKFKENSQSQVGAKCISLLRTNNCMNNEEIIWESLMYYFEENMNGALVQAINVIKFYLNEFGSFSGDLNNFQPLFETVLQAMHNLGEEQLSESMGLAKEMINLFKDYEDYDLSRSVMSYHAFFTSYCQEERGILLGHFKAAADLAVILEKFIKKNPDYEWLNCLNISNSNAVKIKLDDQTIDLKTSSFIDDQSLDESKENKIAYELPLIQIQFLLQLLENGTSGIKSEIRQTIDLKCIMDQLWETLDSHQHHIQAVDLILQFEKIDHEIFMEVVDLKITHNKNDKIDTYLKNINHFILFWKTASGKCFEDFRKIFGEGEFVRTLIRHLDHKLPEISHKAGQWLIEVLQDLDCILKPIFDDLVESIAEFDNKKNLYLLLQGFSELQMIVKYGSDMIVKRSSEIIVPNTIAKAFDNACRIKKIVFRHDTDSQNESYLQLMIKISLMLLLRDHSNNEDDSPKLETSRDILKVKVLACEFLQMVLRQKYVQSAYIAVDSILKSLRKSLLQNELIYEVLHLKLLNILNIVIFDCDISNNPAECRSLFESKGFNEIYFQGITKKENFIKVQWINFMKKCFPLILDTMSFEKLAEFIPKLILCFCHQIRDALIKEPIIDGLESILNMSLSKTLSKEIDKNIKEKFSTVIEFAIGCYKPVKSNFEITTRGTMVNATCDLRNAANKEIVELIKQISGKDQDKVIEAAYLNWIRISMELNPNKDTHECLVKLVGLVVSLELEAYNIFQGFKNMARLLHEPKLIKSKEQEKKKKKELCSLAHFVYTISWFIPLEKFKSEYFWIELISFCKELEKFNIPILVIWINEIINMLMMRMYKVEIHKNNQLSLYEYMQKIIKSLTNFCLLKDEKEVKHPYPPSLYGTEFKHQISSVAIMSLTRTLKKNESTSLIKEFQENLIPQLQSSTALLLQVFTSKNSSNFDSDKNKIKTQLMSELLTSLIDSGRLILAKPHRKEIMDFFTSPFFFTSFKSNPGSFHPWSAIIKCIANSCYGDRYSLITELVNRMYTGLFTRSTTDELRIMALKCISFAVYSGNPDDYISCTPMICEKLIEFMKIDNPNLKRCVYHCTIVQLLKLTSDALNDFWPRLWPHLLMDIWQTMTDDRSEKGDEENAYMMCILNFLDVLTTLMNQDFQLYWWVFFYASTEDYTVFSKNFEENAGSFMPFFVKLSKTRYIGIKEESEFNEKINKINKRPLMIGENVEDLKYLFRAMIRDVMAYSQLITVPDIDGIKKRVEEGFSN